MTGEGFFPSVNSKMTPEVDVVSGRMSTYWAHGDGPAATLPSPYLRREIARPSEFLHRSSRDNQQTLHGSAKDPLQLIIVMFFPSHL